MAAREQAGWKADGLASGTQGKIHFFLRHPDELPVETVVDIGAPFPSAGRDWCAEISGPFTESQLSLMVGGTLTVDGFVARLTAFTSIRGNRSVCTFEAATMCAGTTLYSCPSGVAKATLREDAMSDRLWIPLDGELGILPSGLPTAYATQCHLPEQVTSGTLQIATRTELRFQGVSYTGPLSTPFPFPYIHRAPAAPVFCYSIHQVGQDYYGRELIRVSVESCDEFEKELSARLSVAPGELEATEFMQARSLGILGPQRPFNNVALLDAFTAWGPNLEGKPSTLGVSYVRISDSRESEPLRRHFTTIKTT